MRFAMHALFFVAISFHATLASAHPVHFSFAEMEWNAETLCLEVSLQLEPSDIQVAIRRLAKDPQLTIESKDAAEVIREYVCKNISFANEQDAASELAIRWVGSEVTIKSAWAYFEVPLDAKPESIWVTNRVLFEVADEQINVVNFRNGAHRASARLNAQSPTSSFQFESE